MSRGTLFLIEGRVQGVWFRDSTRRQALELGISGHARNLPDGTVEVLACGEAEAIERLAAWLQQGPPMAKVVRVTAREVDTELPERFSIG